MIEHITAEHSSKDENCSFNCKICGKKFYKVSHLTRHMKIHAPVKPHACELCNKSFARSEQLINHLNAHSGIKPHVCNICSKGKCLLNCLSIFLKKNMHITLYLPFSVRFLSEGISCK